MIETGLSEESAYRDPRDGLRHERAALLDARRRETSKLVPEARAIYPRRLARIAFGAAGVCGGVALGAGTLLGRPGLTTVLVLTWLAAIAAYAAGWIVGRVRLRRALASLLSPTGDSARDVDRLERTTPLMQARRLADPIEVRSVTLPIAGLGVLAPLTLFYLMALFTVPATHRLPRFDWWIALTFATAWPAFAVTALVAFRYARRVRARSLAELVSRHDNEGWGAYGWMVLAVGLWGVGRALVVLLPRANGGEAGAVALATLPVACAALTGLCYLPWMFAALHRRIAQERLHLGIELGGIRSWK